MGKSIRVGFDKIFTNVSGRTYDRLHESFRKSQGFWSEWLKSNLSKLEITASLKIPVLAKICQDIKIPLKEKLELPIEATVDLDTTVRIQVHVPLDLKLDHKDLELGQLSIDVDQAVYVEDDIEIDVDQLLESLVDLDPTWVARLKKALPVHKKAKLKIKQPLKIKGTLTPQVTALNLHLKKSLQLDLEVPIIHQIPVKTTARVEINNTINALIDAPVAVQLEHPIRLRVLDVTLASGISDPL